jgi:mono/diheme cytochrome c family protein
MQPRRTGALVLLLAVAAILASCAQEDYPLSLWQAQHPPPDSGHACMPARAEALPARLVAMSGGSGAAGGVILVSDLFSRFGAVCGSCHGPAIDPPGQGCFQIQTSSDFTTKMTQAALDHVTGSVCPSPAAGTSSTCPAMPDQANPGDPMPPCGSPNGETYSQRSPADPVFQFAELVKEWIAAGKPAQFTPGGSKGSSSGGSADSGAPVSSNASPYTMTAEAGNGMSNIGNCIPGKLTVGLEDARARALDAKFAAMTAKESGTAAEVIGLPEHLGQTDLFTLDSAELARYGVMAYAPNYPLWSDNAGKLRYVRPPRGQPIMFDKATQQFRIPPNTRFYKTFMKLIADTDGSYRYRKIETRLIVSRPDTNNPDGKATQQNALFGTYQWNDSETDATLVETPLNDGKPFADTLLLVNTDEQLAAEILATNPPAPDSLLLQYKAARHYAIPSSQRCIQCHMGSPSQGFVLGFTPLQINRRPTGIGGTIEAVGPDELTQLQRLIDAGLVAGIDSPADILPLEQSQGTRLPRNEHELVAQGYMLGNCAHCHNPRGYPTVTNAPFLDHFDFLPSATGGVFQFPLESTSPRIFRGLSSSTPVPFITPSLVDQPRYSADTGGQDADKFVASVNGALPTWVVYAPWRSIIYRNVDAAFAYEDDVALFPHMPFNTPGYDPRAKQILGEWMVSIPAVRKRPDIPEYAFRTDRQASDNIGGPVVDETPQPYLEVPPDGPGYAAAVSAANQRLNILHTGINPAVPLVAQGAVLYSRFNDPGQTADIIDPLVTINPVCHPTPVGLGGTYPYPFPNQPHWVDTDLTDRAGLWQPRQGNWPDVLVNQVIPPENKGCMAPAGQDAAYADQVRAVGLLQNASLDQLHNFATTEVPFGLWKAPAGCDLSSKPTVGSYTGDQRPPWMDVVNPPSNAPVYLQAPGASVFKMICINCHGPLADSNGRLAQNLATMSGGLAQVADFRTGLFGPLANPGSDIQRVFGQGPPAGEFPPDAPMAWQSTPPDDRAARYMAWMGLGGTAVNIPLSILEIVSVSKVLDYQRHVAATELSANMLSQAKALCLGILGPDYDGGTWKDMNVAGGYLKQGTSRLNSRLIFGNGDAELWLRMCSIANPMPVHVATLTAGTTQVQITEIYSSQGLAIDGAGGIAQGSLVPASAYPVNCAAGDTSCEVGDETGAVKPNLIPCDDTNVNLPPDDPKACNKWPWCLDVPKGATLTDAQVAWINGPNHPPLCPEVVHTASHDCMPPANPSATCVGNEAANTWAVRGAINAGMSVFTYLRETLENLPAPPPDYNQCPN